MRYEATIERTVRDIPAYVVKDTVTGEWLHVYDCFLWAKHKAKELNEKFNICNTCAFSDCNKDYPVCVKCGENEK